MRAVERCSHMKQARTIRASPPDTHTDSPEDMWAGSATGPHVQLQRASLLLLLCELQMERTHIVGVTNLRIIECCKPEVIRIPELVELHIVLAAGHEFA